MTWNERKKQWLVSQKLPKIKENYFISPKQPKKDKKNQKEKSVKSGKSVDKIIFESFLIILD